MVPSPERLLGFSSTDTQMESTYVIDVCDGQIVYRKPATLEELSASNAYTVSTHDGALCHTPLDPAYRR